MKNMKKILMFILTIMLAVSLPACKKTGNNTNPDSDPDPEIPIEPVDPEPGEKLENWGDEILKGISLDLSKFVSLGMERRPNTIRNQPEPIKFKIQEEEKENYMTTLSAKPKTNLMYKSLDAFVEEEIEDTVLVGATEDGEIEEVEFDVEEEFNIFKLLVQDDFTYITITPKTRDGIVMLNIEDDEEEFHQEAVVVARTHPSIQNIIQNSMEYIKDNDGEYVSESTFDKSGYTTDEVFQSYIIDNDSGTIYEFPKELENHKIFNNLLVDGNGIYDINNAINDESNTMDEIIQFIRPGINVYDVIFDKYNNMYIINDELDIRPIKEGAPIYIKVGSNYHRMSMYLTTDNEVIVISGEKNWSYTFHDFLTDPSTEMFIFGEKFEKLPLNMEKTYDLKPSRISTNNNTDPALFKIINGEFIYLKSDYRDLIVDRNNGTGRVFYISKLDNFNKRYSLSFQRREQSLYWNSFLYKIGDYIIIFDIRGDDIHNLKYISLDDLYDKLSSMEIDYSKMSLSNILAVEYDDYIDYIVATSFFEEDREFRVVPKDYLNPEPYLISYHDTGFEELIFSLDEEGKPTLVLKDEYTIGDKTEVELVPIG